MELPKLGLGPMSLDLIDIICDYSKLKDQPFMMVASRNQVDYQGGYVCTTAELINRVRSSGANVLVCRDHCGPYFKNADQGLDQAAAIAQVMRTIDTDIDNGIDLIHVDPSKVLYQRERTAISLIEHILKQAPHMMLEYGSEENIGEACIDETLSKDLDLLEPYRNNIRFVVAQTGSLVKDKQVGTFDVDRVKKLTDMVHERGFLFKEHNADYLTNDQIRSRAKAGVDAMNIAPQLGAMQTRVLHTHCCRNQLSKLWNQFSNEVINGDKWQRWLSSTDADNAWKTIIAGHYHQNSNLVNEMLKIDQTGYQSMLQTTVTGLLDDYTENFR
jgi:hypothetical protein